MQVSIVNYSEIENLSARLDSEYYKPDKLFLEQTLDSKPNSNFDSFGDFIIGPFGSSFKVENYDSESQYRYVRGKDVKPFFLLDNDNVHIPENDFNRLSKYSLEINDVLISVVGTLGNASLITDKAIPSIFSCKSTVFRSSSINPFYLTAFLNSKYGYELLVRKARGAVQTGLNLDDLKYLSILKPSSNLERQIGNILKNAFDKVETGIELYNDSESKILAELNISDWSPIHQLGFTKNFSDTQKSERFDAEYFQPKYDDLVKHIKKYSVGFDSLENLVNIKKCIEPGSSAYQENGIPFIRVSNLSKSEISYSDPKYISENLYSELITHQPKQGEILLSKDATPGIAYYLDKEPIKMIPSSGILRLTVKDEEKIKPEYLTLVLNSILVQQQMLRDAGGSIIVHWRPDQIKATLIPILDDDKQIEIQSKLQESFDCSAKSKALIEIAKRGVEMAIEEDETTAENWMNEEVEKLGVELND